MSRRDEDEGWDLVEEWELLEGGGLVDEAESDTPVDAPLPSLAQMEKDCEWAAEVIEARLAEDPNYPTAALLAEIRTRVRPLSGYRPTNAEWVGLGILAMKAKIADRARELEKEENDGELSK